MWPYGGKLDTIHEHVFLQEQHGEDVKSLLETSRGRRREIATTGKAWALIRETRPGLVPKLVESGVVFARMGPDQKQQVITEIQNLGFVVGENNPSEFASALYAMHEIPTSRSCG